ncbi:MAG: hypothetical protein V7640_191 [Betaproteobacteria bacterium]|jgi:hypothetical protein
MIDATRARPPNRAIEVGDYANAKHWLDEINARAAVQRAAKVLASDQSNASHDPKAWDIMFAKAQFQRG